MCLKYFIVLVKGDQIVEINCIKSHPNWMKSISDSIRLRPIKSLVIPGTHNSGSYSIGYESGLISRIGNLYTLCQDENIYSQLVYGNRLVHLKTSFILD